jgi:hypothetical protein
MDPNISKATTVKERFVTASTESQSTSSDPNRTRFLSVQAAIRAKMQCDKTFSWSTPRGGSGTGHGHVAEAELLKLQRRGQFPDEFVKIEDTQIQYVYSHVLKGNFCVVCY